MKKLNSLKMATKIILFIIFLFFLFFLFSIYTIITCKENFEEDVKKNNITYYVISLRTPDRLANIENQQEKMKANIKIFDGVNGKTVDFEKMDDPVISPSFKPDKQNTLRKNEIGCYLSHYYLYKQIAVTSKTGYTVIFEDDFAIDNEFEIKLLQGLERFADKNFDILYLENSSNNIGEETDVQSICNLDASRALWGTYAYLVNNSNIEKIIQETKLMIQEIDNQLASSIFSKKLTAYTFCPFIAKTNIELPSLIR